MATEPFSTFDPCLDAPCPGLFIKGVGAINLPLSERDAHMIIGASLQSIGNDWARASIASVRRIKELDPEQYELRSSAWQQTIKDIVSRIALDVGASTSAIKAEPHKLLLFTRGAMVRPTEYHFQNSCVELWGAGLCSSGETSRVFGSLEICLPSNHEGGDLHITHDGRTTVLETARPSQFGYSYMAWYAAGSYEVKPVTSGYRLMLIYNLTHVTSGVLQPISTFHSAALELQDVFALWNESIKRREVYPKKLAYILDGRYKNENMGIAHLRGSDKLRARQLGKLCSEADFCLYLASLERTIRGGCDEDEDDTYGYGNAFGGSAYFGHGTSGKCMDDNGTSFHEITEVYEETIKLKRVIDLDGSKFATDVRIEERDIVQPDPFAKGPDREDYSDPTEDDGVTATHYYSRMAILLMPRACVTEFLFESVKMGQPDVESWIERLIESVRVHPSDSRRKDELAQLCQQIIEMNRTLLEKTYIGQFTKFEWESKNEQYLGRVIGRVVNASLLLGRLDLFQDALAVVPRRLSPWIYVDIGKAIHTLGFTKMMKELDEAAPRLTRIYERYNALDDILFGYELAERQGSKRDDLAGLEEWARAKIQGSLNNRTPVFKKDGSALVRIIQKYGDKFLFQCVLPFIKANASNATFVMAFATKLFEAGENGTIARNVVLGVFRDILADMTPELTLGFDAETSKRQKTDLTLSVPIVDVPPVPSIPLVRKINGQSIADLVGQCTSLGLNEEASRILEKLTFESQTAYHSAFETVLLPFLKRLLSILQQHQIPLSTTPYQRFTQHLIATYLMRHVRVEPRDWVRPRYGCGCDDCDQLDKFLADSNFGSVSFTMAKKRRDHIETRLPRRGYSIETVKSSTPHELVVKKTEDEGCKSMTRWKQRCEGAEKLILALGTEEQLRQVLGPRYEELTTLRLVKLPTTQVAWTVAPGRRVRFS